MLTSSYAPCVQQQHLQMQWPHTPPQHQPYYFDEFEPRLFCYDTTHAEHGGYCDQQQHYATAASTAASYGALPPLMVGDGNSSDLEFEPHSSSSCSSSSDAYDSSPVRSDDSFSSLDLNSAAALVAPPYALSSSGSGSIGISSVIGAKTALSSVSIASGRVMYRDVFHRVTCVLPSERFDGQRVYIGDACGYPGNAKFHRREPFPGELALVLQCAVLDAERLDERLRQCASCRAYYESRRYFKLNPECKGRLALVKCSQAITVVRGRFDVQLKFMCCSQHQVNCCDFLLQLSLSDSAAAAAGGAGSSLATQTRVFVKQWKKSTQKKKDYVLAFQ